MTTTAGGGETRLWWAVFTLLALACGAWILAVPPVTGPDEWANQVRAAAATRGQIVGDKRPETGNIATAVDAPEGIVDLDGQCFIGQQRRTAVVAAPDEGKPRVERCSDNDGGSRLVEALTYEYRSPPALYVLVGVPSLVFTSELGSYLMRLVGALVWSALLASALVSLLRLSAAPAVLLGLAIALSPKVVYLAATTNFAGTETVAALALFVNGLVLVRTAPDRRLVTRFGVALLVLVVARGLSPGFAVLILGLLAVLAGRDQLKSLLARWDVRAWLGVGLVGSLLSAAWVLYLHAEFPLAHREGTGLGNALADVGWWLREMVGVFGSTDVVPPAVVPWLWLVAAVAVLVLGWARGNRIELALALVLALGAVALLVSGQGFSVPQTGYYWQGRYALPLMVLAPLVALAPRRGAIDEPAGRSSAMGVRGCALVVLPLVLVGHMWSLLYALRHYTVGFDGPRDPRTFLFDPIWSPPIHPALVVLVAAGSLVGLAAVLARSLGPPEPEDAPDSPADVVPEAVAV